MNRNGKSALATLIVGAGIAVLFVWPPAAVALTLVGLYVGFHAVRRHSSAISRALWLAALAMHVGVVGVASGSWYVASAALPFLFLMTPSEWIVQRFGYRAIDAILPTMVLGAGILIVSWPPTPYWLAAVGVFTYGTSTWVRASKVIRRIDANRPAAWDVEIGSPVPDIRLPTRNHGSEFRLSGERGQFVLLYFLRSDWCPMCQVMMRVLKREDPRLAKRDVKVVVISPSAGQEADDFAEALGLDYTILVDPDHSTAKLFGALDLAAFGGKGAPFLSAFLVGPEGQLRYASSPENVQSFLDPSEVLQIVEAA